MRSKARLPRLGMALSVLLCGTAIALPAQAENATQTAGLLRLPNVTFAPATPQQMQQAARIDGRGTQGMRAYIDPESNELRGQSPEERFMTPEVSVGKSRAKAGLVMRPSATGGVLMEVDESVMSYSLVKRNASGKVEMQCVTGEQAARAALLRPFTKEDGHEH